jgi:hypothetical protein
MTFLEASQRIELDLGRMALPTTPAEWPSAEFSAAFSGASARERLQRQSVRKPDTSKTGGTGGQRVGGNDPGFGRTMPPKPARVPRGSFPPTRCELIRVRSRKEGEL